MSPAVRLRVLQAVSVAAALFASAGCTTTTRENVLTVTENPADRPDWRETELTSEADGRAARERVLARHPGLVVDNNPALMAEAESVFAEVARARRALLNRSTIAALRNPTLADARARREAVAPKLYLLGVDAPYAKAFPDGSLVLSRRLVEGLQAAAGQDPWTLRFVAAHELTHHQDGHSLFDRQTREGQRQADREIAKAKASEGGRDSYVYRPTAVYTAFEHHAALMEFMADFWAYYTLREMQAPEGVTAAALVAIRDSSGPETDQGLGNARALCMSLLDGPVPLAAKAFGVREGQRRGTALLPVSFAPYIDSDGRRMLFELFPTAEPMNFYLSCASAALNGRAGSARHRKLFQTADPAAFRAGFIADLEAIRVVTDALGYEDVVDGMMLEEPAIAARLPKSMGRPNLWIEKVERTGQDGAYNRVEVTVMNEGLAPSSGGFALAARRDGAPRPFVQCETRAESGPPTRGPCEVATVGRPLRSQETVKVPVYLADDGTGDRARPTTFVVDPCDAQAVAGPCRIDETYENDNTREAIVDRISQLRVQVLVALPAAATGQVEVIQVGIENRGGAVNARPYRLTATASGWPFDLYRCKERTPACRGVIVPPGLEDDGNTTVVAYLAEDREQGRLAVEVEPCDIPRPGQTDQEACNAHDPD